MVYDELLKNPSKYIGVILQYPDEDLKDLSREKIKVLNQSYSIGSDKVNLGVIGAGLFGKALLLPALSKIDKANLHILCTSSGANSYHTGNKYRFNIITSDYKEVINSDDVHAVVILTPHSQHKRMVIEALEKRKHIFVEKPLCISEEELIEIDSLYTNIDKAPFIMVGYNRRFSIHSLKAYEFIKDRTDPVLINYRINAGFVPKSHWVHYEEEGRSRIVGEICHFVDMLIYLTGSIPLKIFAERVRGNDRSVVNSDNLSIIISFKDGSIGNIFYTASGDKAFSRERVEIYCEGKTIIINDYRETTMFFNGKRKNFKTFNQDLGYKKELEHFINVIKGVTVPLITYKEIYYSTLSIFKIEESIDKGIPIYL
jgi:predicted dehydrogenase